MDPFTAIGAASAILSFIEFSWKLVAGAKEIYKSADGSSKDNAGIKTMIGNLRDVTKGLGAKSLGNSKPEEDLRKLTSECNTLSGELMKTLQELQGTGSICNSVKVKWKIMRKKDDIGPVRERLAEYTSQITMVINTMLLDGQSGIKSQLDSIQAAGSQAAKTRSMEMEDVRKALESSLANATSIQQDVGELRGDSTRDHDMTSQHTRILHEVRSRLDQLQDLTRVVPVEQRILRHVFYKSMYHREEAIRKAEDGTYAWLLGAHDDNSVDQGMSGLIHIDSNLRQFEANQRNVRESATKTLIAWLRQGNGVFHLSGKAGSGKSTAMKLIAHHRRTRDELIHWASGGRLVTSQHYFWNTGDEMQKSLEGLYRSILFDILRQCPSLIPAVFPGQWDALAGDIQQGFKSQGPVDIEESLFRRSEMKNAFDRLIMEELDDQYCVCLFVDGLDEFQGDSYEHRQLAEAFLRWSKRPNVKCLISSRPYAWFQQTFHKSPRLHLHLLNKQDIYVFALHMFEKDTNIDRMRSYYKSLVDEVVSASKGVFLWAFLVVRFLLGSAGYDSKNMLFRKLRTLPAELKKLYQLLLDSFEPPDQQRVNQMLLLKLKDSIRPQRQWPLSAFAFSLVDHLEDPTFPFDGAWHKKVVELFQQFGLGEQSILSLTKGLLEVAPCNDKYDEPAGLHLHAIEFSHRTLADYLRSRSTSSYVPTFNFADVHCRLSLAELAVLTSLGRSYRITNRCVQSIFAQYWPAPDDADALLPSFDTLKRLGAVMPDLSPPAYLEMSQSYPQPYTTALEGRILSFPHFCIFKGLSEYALSADTSKIKAASPASELNLLLCWVSGLVHQVVLDRNVTSQVTLRLLSHGFHFKDKVRIYYGKHTDDMKLATASHQLATVWMVFVSRLVSLHIDASAMIREDWDALDAEEEFAMAVIQRDLDTLAVFLSNRADPDVVISFEDDDDAGYYTSLVDFICALRQNNPESLDFEDSLWKDLMSREHGTRTLPSWARRIPGADPEAVLMDARVLADSSYPPARYICSREECISTETWFRIY